MPERRAKRWPIQAQSAAIAWAMASICNDDRAAFGGMSGHDRKTLRRLVAQRELVACDPRLLADDVGLVTADAAAAAVVPADADFVDRGGALVLLDLTPGHRPADGAQHGHRRLAAAAAHLVAGAANKVIARELDISEATVKSHVAAIFEEFDVASRTQVVIEFARRGLRTGPHPWRKE